MKSKSFIISLSTIVLILFALTGYSQTDAPSGKSDEFNLGYKLGESKWYFNYNILTPSGIVYFDLGEDYPPDSMGNYPRPDFYKDGSANFNVQLLSGDLFYGEKWLRGGFSAGFGISTNFSGDTKEPSYIIGNFGVALTLDQNVRVELGMSYGISAKESYTIKYDNAFYVGLSFPTNLSENIKKAIKVSP